MLKSIDSKKVANFLVNNALVIFLVGVSIAVGIMRPRFFSEANAANLISNTSIRFIIALGVSGCLIVKGPDLSAGRSVGLAACLAATFLQRTDFAGKVYPEIGDISLIIVLLGVVVITATFGLLNGLVVSYLKVPPFIATMGMMTIIYGICMIFTGNQPIGGLRPEYLAITSGSLFNIRWLPYLGFIAAIIGGIMWFLYNKTAHGKYMYAIGGNENAAEVSGISTKRTKIIIFTLAGVMYGIAGFLQGAKAGGASTGLGFGWELEAIAGCTIGGVSTNGGVGKISGILTGVLVFELLKIAMNFMGVQADYTYIVQGLVVILAIALDMRKYAIKR